MKKDVKDIIQKEEIHLNNLLEKEDLSAFKGMSPYAERTDYPSFLANVYNDRIKPIIETENVLIPKRKPITDQMDNLQ